MTLNSEVKRLWYQAVESKSEYIWETLASKIAYAIKEKGILTPEEETFLLGKMNSGMAEGKIYATRTLEFLADYKLISPKGLEIFLQSLLDLLEEETQFYVRLELAEALSELGILLTKKQQLQKNRLISVESNEQIRKLLWH